jgi:uncharacterized protein YndB with AHSA1/START domain
VLEGVVVMAEQDGRQNGIEREIVIDAPVERVWGLVSRPGWWIGGADGDASGQQRSREGELEIIEDPRYGRFGVRVESSEPPGYIAYRGAPLQPGEALDRRNGTLVEFWLTPSGGGTTVRVLETGFEDLDLSDEDRRKAVEGNIEGWRLMMAVLRKRAAPGAGDGTA